MQSATVIVPLVWRHKRKLSDFVGQNKNNANPATFPRVEPCSTNATMWPRRNVENSEVEKERMYYEGQEEIMKAYELQWGAFTRADLEHCRLKLLEITAFQQDGEKKQKPFLSPQTTPSKLIQFLENVRLSMCLWTTWVWYRFFFFLRFKFMLCNKNIWFNKFIF